MKNFLNNLSSAAKFLLSAGAVAIIGGLITYLFNCYAEYNDKRAFISAMSKEACDYAKAYARMSNFLKSTKNISSIEGMFMPENIISGNQKELYHLNSKEHNNFVVIMNYYYIFGKFKNEYFLARKKMDGIENKEIDKLEKKEGYENFVDKEDYEKFADKMRSFMDSEVNDYDNTMLLKYVYAFDDFSKSLKRIADELDRSTQCRL